MKSTGIVLGVAAAFCFAAAFASGQAANTKATKKAVGNATAGADVYQHHCAGCHGDDGKAHTRASTSFHALDYRDPAVMKMSDADLMAIIYDGKNHMPAFGKRLSQDDMANVVAYIHTLQKK